MVISDWRLANAEVGRPCAAVRWRLTPDLPIPTLSRVRTRRLRIEWEPGSKVDGLLTGPGEGRLGILLAHGAGAGQRHPFMAGLRHRLGAAVPVLSFDYAYIQAGRKAPDRMPRLLSCHEAAFDRLAERCDRVVVAGKSMGGRVGGHLAAGGRPADRLVFLGYPLVPLGTSEPRDTSHLANLGDLPMLFIQGERDRMAPLELVRALVEDLVEARLETIPEGDHSFRVPKRTGLDPETVLDRIAGWILEFAS